MSQNSSNVNRLSRIQNYHQSVTESEDDELQGPEQRQAITEQWASKKKKKKKVLTRDT